MVDCLMGSCWCWGCALFGLLVVGPMKLEDLKPPGLPMPGGSWLGSPRELPGPDEFLPPNDGLYMLGLGPPPPPLNTMGLLPGSPICPPMPPPPTLGLSPSGPIPRLPGKKSRKHLVALPVFPLSMLPDMGPVNRCRSSKLGGPLGEGGSVEYMGGPGPTWLVNCCDIRAIEEMGSKGVEILLLDEVGTQTWGCPHRTRREEVPIRPELYQDCSGLLIFHRCTNCYWKCLATLTGRLLLLSRRYKLHPRKR